MTAGALRCWSSATREWAAQRSARRTRTICPRPRERRRAGREASRWRSTRPSLRRYLIPPTPTSVTGAVHEQPGEREKGAPWPLVMAVHTSANAHGLGAKRQPLGDICPNSCGTPCSNSSALIDTAPPPESRCPNSHGLPSRIARRGYAQGALRGAAQCRAPGQRARGRERHHRGAGEPFG